MKKRIKIDSAILSFIIILTGFLYQFKGLYPKSILIDDFFDFLGLFVVFLGTLVRMSARGYKKMHSQKSKELVVDGPYSLVRNPMYLGSFLLGAGFVLIVWPWWSLPLFAGVFYARFSRQILKEEVYLKKSFGDTYEKYMKKVPRLFPDIKRAKKTKLKKVFPHETSWNTKEKWGLLGWPALAIILETMQENIVFGFADIRRTIAIFFVSAVTFGITLLGDI